MAHTGTISVDTLALFHTPGRAPEQVCTQLGYDPSDPYAVTVRVYGSRGPVQWTFARDLLDDGMLAVSGDGDITVRPRTGDPSTVVMELDASAGNAVLSADARELTEFLDRTYDLVPLGQESLWIDLDHELAVLLADD